MAIKSISMPDEVKAYLDAMPNASAYVVELVLKDQEAKKGEVGIGLEKLVKRIVNDALKENEDRKRRVNGKGVSLRVSERDDGKEA